MPNPSNPPPSQPLCSCPRSVWDRDEHVDVLQPLCHLGLDRLLLHPHPDHVHRRLLPPLRRHGGRVRHPAELLVRDRTGRGRHPATALHRQILGLDQTTESIG